MRACSGTPSARSPSTRVILRRDGSFRYLDPAGDERVITGYIQPEWRKNTTQDLIVPLVRKLVGMGQQVIVFREQTGQARGCANYLAEALGLPPAQDAIAALPTGDPSIASEVLRATLASGVAFHISHLGPEERAVIEAQFRAPETALRVIAATTTLAMGVNTPASSVVIAGLMHPGDNPYSVAEYKNMVGRAGRLGYAEEGISFLLALSPLEEHEYWSRYVRGRPEDIASRFFERGTDPRSLIVRVLVAAERPGAQGLASEEIVGFLEGSFGAFQQQELAQEWRVDRARFIGALRDLEGHQLVEVREEDDRYHLTDLGRLAGEGGVEVESVTRVVVALRPLRSSEITDPTFLAVVQATIELDQVRFPINASSKRAEPQTWMAELQRQGVPASVLQGLRRSSDPKDGTIRTKKAAACLHWVTDMPLADIEKSLTRHGGAFDGIAGPLRNLVARTYDLLPTVMRIAELLHPGLDLTERRTRLLTRLEVGIPAAGVELAAQSGTRLTRADYLRLLRAGLLGIEAIEASADEALLDCLGYSDDKLLEVRRGARAHREQERERAAQAPPIPLYES